MPFQTESLDDKDAGILLALSHDARVPLSRIAEEVGLSVAAVGSRVSKLEERGIIRDYKLVLNHGAFPFEEYDIYYGLTDTSPFIVRDIMKKLSSSPNTTQVLSTMGTYDIRITAVARNMSDLHRALDEVERDFSAHILDRVVLLVTRKHKSRAESFLSQVLGKPIQRSDKALKEVYHPAEARLDDVDRKLLLALGNDPRASFTSLSEDVDLTAEGVSARVRRLEEKGIILGYKALIDGPRLGYRFAVIPVSLRHLSEDERDKVRDFVQQHSSVSSAVETMGSYNLSLTVFGRTLDDIRQIELDFRASFGDHLTKNAMVFILDNEKYPSLATAILEKTNNNASD